MKRRSVIGIFSLGFIIGSGIFASGCARMELDQANLSTHVQMNSLRGSDYQIVKSFKENRWNHYFLFQLAPTARPNISEIISPHVEQGDIVVDLRVKKQTKFVNGLICALIGFIYCPDTLTIEGNVARRVQKAQ